MPQLEAMGDTAQLVFAMYFHALGLPGCAPTNENNWLAGKNDRQKT
jgi:hypothetical protein